VSGVFPDADRLRGWNPPIAGASYPNHAEARERGTVCERREPICEHSCVYQDKARQFRIPHNAIRHRRGGASA
jgi:hypothetical protein